MAIFTEKLRTDLEELKPGLPEDQTELRERLDVAIRKLDEPDADSERPLREKMDAAYQARNLVRLMISGIEVDGERLVKIADDSLMNVESLGIDPSLVKGLAKSLYEAKKAKPGETIAIAGSTRNIEIIEEIARLCIADDVNFVLDIYNSDLEAIMVNNADDEGITRLGEERTATYDPTKIKLEARSNSTAEFDPAQMGKYGKALSRYISRVTSGDLDFSLTIIPTEKDAELDGMEYDEYMRLFFESCDQPWKEISKAQASLVEKLNQGKVLKITNADGTDLTIDIEGFTFVNSGADANIPGSETFSAPKKEGVNGTLVSKGSFKYGNFPLVKNITLVFENGKIIEAHAEEGEETLKQIISTDEGSVYTGEIAFGTNPHLRRHFVNGLLVEKIGGSFHLAIGACYTFKKYGGQEVSIDNGNKSDIHWDITTLLQDGQVSLDGQLIQQNGLWVDETGAIDQNLAVLNYGWGALPEDQQPDWWQERYPNGYEEVVQAQ